MNTTKTLAAAGLAAMLILSSFTMEKRPVLHAGAVCAADAAASGPDHASLAARPSAQQEHAELSGGPSAEPAVHISAASGLTRRAAAVAASDARSQLVLPGKAAPDGLSKTANTTDSEQGQKPAYKPRSATGAKTAPAPDDTRKFEGLGIAAFILGIVGWFMPLVLGLIMFILAIVFGALSFSKITRSPDKFKGKGLALAGLILGIAGVGILLLAALLI
ncbi:MAG: DUF4190 domain-containing protein [Bacteroidia bacterium]|nr:DUF4190 domain-containing protein [Bacteroidia bacterium]